MIAWIERPVSAVTVRNAHHVDFYSVVFENLAATALDFVDNVSDCVVQQCTFGNIGGTAIMGGSFAESPREVHRPYTDLAERCQRLTIQENFVVDAANEDWGAVGIGLGYVRHCTISKNHVFFLSYSGICVGWGWTPLNTGMENNRIEGNNVSNYARQLYDAGGIYTLSNQPGSVISGNKISSIWMPVPTVLLSRTITPATSPPGLPVVLSLTNGPYVVTRLATTTPVQISSLSNETNQLPPL